MKDKGWLPSSVVTINGSGDVIDGQHRVKAAMSVGSPIRYKVTRGAGTDEMTSMNTLQRNWSPFDHLHKFVVRGNPAYITFQNFVNDFPEYKYTEVAMFLNNSLHSVDRDVFEQGRYFTKDVSKGRLWASQIRSLKPFFAKYYNKAIFVRAMIKVMANKPEFIFDEFFHKVNLRPANLVPCGTVEQYVELIESIYNYRRSDKVNLRF